MNITTENIEEWCFRYLEKDLDEKERIFFEKELQTNTALQKEYALWQKTVVQLSAPARTDVNFIHSLFRYKSQLLLVLTEFILLGALVLTVLYNIPIEKSSSMKRQTPLPKDTGFIHTSAPVDLIVVEDHSFKKSTAIADTMQQIDRCSAFPEKNQEAKITDPDLFDAVDSVSVPHQATIEQKIISPDTAAVQHSVKEKKKNKTSGIKRNGSRLVPINNDL